MKFYPSPKIILLLLLMPFGVSAHLQGKIIPANDPEAIKGLSALNWAVGSGAISAGVGGASFDLAFPGTRRVALRVDTSAFAAGLAAGRYPVVAWSVNGGPRQKHQLKAGETTISLAADTFDARIDFYTMGFSPFEDRYTGEHSINAVRITGYEVDESGRVTALPKPPKLWLNIGDSIMSGDASLERPNQGRPADDAWAGCTDARASYGYLLAQHFGYAESRLAYGGYNYGGGAGSVPALATLIDQTTSLTSRLRDGKLQPAPDVILMNLGENGVPEKATVTATLAKLRLRAGVAAKMIVMVPVSGKARAEVTSAFNAYRDASHDAAIYLVDLGGKRYETADGQHPTAAGHRAIYEGMLGKMAEIVR